MEYLARISSRKVSSKTRALWRMGVTMGIIAYLSVGGTLHAAEETHECHYHSYYYNSTFGDLINIYGCVYGDFSRYLNAYDVQGLAGGVPVRVVVTPIYANSGQLMDDVQIVWYPIGGGNAIAFSPVVITNASSPGPVTLNWTPPVSGQYELVVSTTSYQSWNANDGSFGVYNILISQTTAVTPGPTTPTPVRGRETSTPGPAATATPTRTPTPTSTPTPTPDARHPRKIPFR